MNILFKVLIPSSAVLFLMGCQKSSEAPAQTPATQTEKTVSVAKPVEAKAVVQTSYQCDHNKMIYATYDNSDANQSKVTLIIDGKTYQLTQAVAASGARYTTEHGPLDGFGLDWHTKGADAIASTITFDHAVKPNSEKILFTCHE